MRYAASWILAAILIAGCAGQTVRKDDVLYDICRANHLFDVYQKEKLAFTFNVRLPGKTVKRTWEWHVKTDRIFLNGQAHDRSAMFVNDIYWLLFPLMAHEDRDKTVVTVNRQGKGPLSGRALTEVVIRYIDGRGYTPNDTYRLYVDDDMMIREWSYLKAGKEPPLRTTTWEAYETYGGVTISLMRKGPGDFKVWFTDVSLE